MRVTYSGIVIEVLKLLDLERVPVLDDAGVDYLFTKVTLRCMGLVTSDQVVNSLRSSASETVGMSYQKTGGSSLDTTGALNIGRPANIEHSENSNPIVTDRTIRHWLTVPRRRLIIETDAQDFNYKVLLVSPTGSRSPADAHNGPFPEVFSIQESFGDARCFVVGFQVTTYINECGDATGNLGAFLANRFSQSQDVDQDGFVTITTTGEAHFRTDLVYGVLNPDNLRPFLFLPIPNGYKRENIQVIGSPDCGAIRYSFTDRQTHQQLVVGDEVNATRVQCTYRQAVMQNDNSIGSVMQAIDQYYNSKQTQNFGKSPKKRRSKKKKPEDEEEEG